MVDFKIVGVFFAQILITNNLMKESTIVQKYGRGKLDDIKEKGRERGNDGSPTRFTLPQVKCHNNDHGSNNNNNNNNNNSNKQNMENDGR